jgi:hypothetical protein
MFGMTSVKGYEDRFARKRNLIQAMQRKEINVKEPVNYQEKGVS